MTIAAREASPLRGRMLFGYPVGMVAAVLCGFGPAAHGANPVYTPGAGPGLTENERLKNAAEAEFGLYDGAVVILDVDTAPGARQRVDVPIAGWVATLDIWPHSVRASNYRLLAQIDTGEIVEMEPGPVRTVRGVVIGNPGSMIAGGVTSEGLSATVILGDGSRHWIEPLSGRVPGAPFGSHVVYRNEDIIPSNGECGNDDVRDHVLDDEQDQVEQNGDLLAGGLERTEIAADADFEYFQDYGSVAAVATRIGIVTNSMNPQYENQVGITHCITAVIVRTAEPDPYTSTSSGVLLCQFITEWTNNQQGLDFDVAKLFTGKSINGGTIGQAATFGDICDRQGCCGCGAFGLDDGAFCHSENDCCGSLGCATDLMAHELGHLWDAVHCDPCNTTMRSFIGCFNSFSPGTISDIISHRNSRSCLDTSSCDAVSTGACCLPTGVCLEASSSECNAQGGEFQGVGVFCNLPNLCPEGSGACCYSGGQCVFSLESDCVDTDGTFVGPGTTCTPEICSLITGACCFDVSCVDLSSADCIAFGGAFEGDGTVCGGNLCGALNGACCFADGTCIEATSADCGDSGGDYQSDGGNCNPNLCPQPPATGACCFGDGVCNVLTEDDCAGAAGQYSGDDTACSPNDCPQPPDCAADTDGNLVVDFQDLLAVLAAWGTDGTGSDIAEPLDVVDFQDLLGLLASWGPCE